MAGPPSFIPYGRQSIDEQDIAAVVDVLRSDWLTTGPQVDEFEKTLASFTGVAHAVAVSNGTAALHTALFAAGVGPGDEVIVPSLTFAADANAALYLGATPVFAEVSEDDLLIRPDHVAKLVSPRTKAIIAVDYAGQPCDYAALRKIASAHKLTLVADACHSLGGARQGQKVGQMADLTVLSFHPVKHITTGEGGMVLTDNPAFNDRMRRFRNHGITTDHRQRAATGALGYEMVDLGYNYRLCDIQCALGRSQMRHLPQWVKRRQEIASLYSTAFRGWQAFTEQTVAPDTSHAYHLYVVKLALESLPIGRDQINLRMRELKIGVNAHYPPLHLHPYYRQRFGYQEGALPVTEDLCRRVLSLPMYPAMTNDDVNRVITGLEKVLAR